MTDSTERGIRCQLCGETCPEPEALCLARYFDVVIIGKPCEYSVEGQARTAAALDARAAGITVNTVGDE